MGSARDKNNAEAVKYWWPNRMQTEKACKEAETLAFVYLITQDKKYGEGARRWVLHLASWNPGGPTNFRLNCEAGKPMLYRPARAYDWAHDMFTFADREKIHAAMQRRVADAWESGEIAHGTGHLNSPYNSHGNRIWHKVGEAGTRDKSRQLGMLTVLAPYRVGKRPEWSAEREETKMTIGVRLTSGEKRVTVAFPKPGARGKVRVGGQ